jgi:hypothetical protein
MCNSYIDGFVGYMIGVGVKLGCTKKEIIVSSPKVLAFSNTTYVDDEEAIATTDG